jgi:hypothetical protein
MDQIGLYISEWTWWSQAYVAMASWPEWAQELPLMDFYMGVPMHVVPEVDLLTKFPVALVVPDGGPEFRVDVVVPELLVLPVIHVVP